MYGSDSSHASLANTVSRIAHQGNALCHIPFTGWFEESNLDKTTMGTQPVKCETKGQHITLGQGQCLRGCVSADVTACVYRTRQVAAPRQAAGSHEKCGRYTASN